MKRIIAAMAVSMAMFAAVAGAAVNVGDSPKLKFTSMTHQKVDIAELKGKRIVVVDFWASWCGPCMQEAPHMVAINKKYKDQGLQIIGISLDQALADAAGAVKEHELNWPQECDSLEWHSPYASEWGVDSIPRTFIIGPDGVVLWTGHPALMDEPLAAAFRDHPPKLIDQAVIDKASVKLDEVDKALAANNPQAAIKSLGQVSSDAMSDKGIAGRVSDDQKKLQDVGTTMLAEVQPLIDGNKYLEAVSKLTDLSKGFFGSPISTSAQKQLADLMKNPDCKAAVEKAKRDQAAADLLRSAQQLQATSHDAEAYFQFKQVVARFPSTPAGQTAAASVAEYEKNPDFVKAANSGAVAEKAKSRLGLAEVYLKNGMADLARKKYQSVIDDFPGTEFADTASAAIHQLDAPAAAGGTN